MEKILDLILRGIDHKVILFW